MTITRALAVCCAALWLGCVEDVELAAVPGDAALLDAALQDVNPIDRVSVDMVTPTDHAPLDVLPSDVTPADAIDVTDAVEDLDDRPAPSALTVQVTLVSQLEGGSSSEWQSEIDVSVTRGGAAVTGVLVTWTSPLGTVVLTQSEGHFRASREGYLAWSEITVSATGERAVTQRWNPPVAHTITSPRADESHTALTPLDVTWTPTGAMEAQITAPATLTATTDTGRATVPGAYFPRDARAVAVRVRRRSVTPLTSFATGSTVRSDVVAASSVIVPPPP